MWLGAKALVVAGLAALFVVVRFACVALLRRLPDGPLKKVLALKGAEDGGSNADWTHREWLWVSTLCGSVVAMVWATYAYLTPH